MRVATLALSLAVLSAAACKSTTSATPAEAPAAAPQEVRAMPSSEATANEEAAPSDAVKPATGNRRPLLGGYGARDVSDAGVVQAAAEAVRLLKADRSDDTIALVRIRQAETQVVAGMNFRLDLDLRTAAGEESVRVVVLQALDGTYTLTSATPAN